MPYKNRKKYRAYQKAYYQKRKRANSAGGLTSTVKPIEGLTANRILDPAINPTKKTNSIPQNQRVTATTSIISGINSIPFNPAKSIPPFSSGNIVENTRRHVEKLRREGWKIDDVGNASRRVDSGTK
jgi:hypothetical protein